MLSMPVAVDPRTYEVLSWSQRISALSAGAFDVTVGAKLVAAGFLPEPADGEWPSEDANFRDFSLVPDNRVLLRRRVWIDLGGIAKGYAVDRAVETLKQNGVGGGVVNAGGDLCVFGAPQPIHIRHPEDVSRLFSLGGLADVAVASSSGCFTADCGGRNGSDALIDPRRNAALQWRQSVTIIAARCLVADALTKVVRLAPQRAAKILPPLGAQAIVIDRRSVRSFAPETQRRGVGSEIRFSDQTGLQETI